MARGVSQLPQPVFLIRGQAVCRFSFLKLFSPGAQHHPAVAMEGASPDAKPAIAGMSCLRSLWDPASGGLPHGRAILRLLQDAIFTRRWRGVGSAPACAWVLQESSDPWARWCRSGCRDGMLPQLPLPAAPVELLAAGWPRRSAASGGISPLEGN